MNDPWGNVPLPFPTHDDEIVSPEDRPKFRDQRFLADLIEAKRIELKVGWDLILQGFPVQVERLKPVDQEDVRSGKNRLHQVDIRVGGRHRIHVEVKGFKHDFTGDPARYPWQGRVWVVSKKEFDGALVKPAAVVTISKQSWERIITFPWEVQTYDDGWWFEDAGYYNSNGVWEVTPTYCTKARYCHTWQYFVEWLHDNLPTDERRQDDERRHEVSGV